MAEFDVDLFVIGGGSGGVRAARIAAGHGARVMVAEEYLMGGAHNRWPARRGIEHKIESSEVCHLAALPKRIVIQGVGYIVLEFACIFAGFGSDVTLVSRGGNVLRGFGEDLRAHVRREMEQD